MRFNMSKNKGTLFSKSMFGYKRSDVNNYIRESDELHASEVSALKLENERMSRVIREYEDRISELEAILEKERKNTSDTIRKLTEESERKLSEARKSEDEVQAKLNESEARATAYLKMADSSAIRAESAETESSILSVSLEEARKEIDQLKVELAEKNEDKKRLAELEEITKRYAARYEEEKEARRKNPILRLIGLFK